MPKTLDALENLGVFMFYKRIAKRGSNMGGVKMGSVRVPKSQQNPMFSRQFQKRLQGLETTPIISKGLPVE